MMFIIEGQHNIHTRNIFLNHSYLYDRYNEYLDRHHSIHQCYVPTLSYGYDKEKSKMHIFWLCVSRLFFFLINFDFFPDSIAIIYTYVYVYITQLKVGLIIWHSVLLFMHHGDFYLLIRIYIYMDCLFYMKYFCLSFCWFSIF